MKKSFLALLAFLVLASAGYGQTVPVVNPSFEANPPAGNYNYACPQGWACKGQYFGMQNPTAAQLPIVPDGKTVFWAQSATTTQDLGPSDTTKNYTLTYFVGSQSSFPAPKNYSVSLGIPCTLSGAAPTTAGAMVQQTLTCTGAGELLLTLTAGSSQVMFDNVILTSQSVVPPIQNIVTINISATYDDGSIPTILTINVNDVTDPKNTIGQLSLTPDPSTGASAGVFTLVNTETYQVALLVAGSQVGQTFYEGGLVLALMPQLSQVNSSIVLFKASGAVKSFSSSAQ